MDAKVEGFDVVVIGGGPAGCYAAKTTAEHGLRTLIIEEHATIGSPRHCTGWLIGAKFAHEIVEKTKAHVSFQKLNGLARRDIKSGEILEEVSNIAGGGYFMDRHMFDKEIARLAIEAGADLMLNTRVVDLIKEEGRIIGVRSNRIPEIKAKVVICADGILSINNGFARKQLITEEKEAYVYYKGVQLELANVSDVNPGWIEIFETPDPEFIRRTTLWHYSISKTMTTFATLDDFESFKLRDDNFLSKKIKRAFPVQIVGYMNRNYMGKFLDEVVGKGILFVGDASGNSGTIHGMISGYYAGEVAARAVKEHNIEILFEYKSILKNSDIYKSPYFWRQVGEFYGSYKNCLLKFNEIEV